MLRERSGPKVTKDDQRLPDLKILATGGQKMPTARWGQRTLGRPD
jgi:hypothetical protein